MNIAVNTRVLLSSRMEGVCRYIHEVLRRMVLDNPQDQFFFFFDRKYDDKFIYAKNVVPVVLRPQARHPLLWYWWFEKSLPRAFKKYNIDVFYSGDTYLSLKTNVPTLLVSHDIAYAHYPSHLPFLNLKYYEYFFPKFHQKAKAIIAVSNFTKNDIIEKYNLDPQKITVGFNAQKEGLKTLSESQKNKVKKKYTNGKPYFLYVGSIHPRKNVIKIIEAFDEFKEASNSDKKLVLIGRMAWNVDQFKSAMTNAKFKKDIIHLSELFNEEVNEITASAFSMIYISLFEGFGLPILEAIHCEVPVICSNTSSMPEVAGDAALLVDPTNLKEITNAMIKMEKSKEIRVELIQNAKKQTKKFDWGKTAKLTYQALKDISN